MRVEANDSELSEGAVKFRVFRVMSELGGDVDADEVADVVRALSGDEVLLRDVIAGAVSHFRGETVEIPERRWTVSTPLRDEAWLRSRFVDLDGSARDIATELGCSIASVKYALRRYRIVKGRRLGGNYRS